MNKIIERKLGEFMFPVIERPVYFENDSSQSYTKAGEYQAIMREHTDSLISIMPKSYKLVSNKEIILPLVNELEKLKTPWYLDDSHSYIEDSNCRLQITFPKITLNDGTSDIALSIFLGNSYNGTQSVKLTYGAIRLICSNGLILGVVLSNFYRKHTSGLQTKYLRNQIESIYEKLPVVQYRIEQLQNTQVTAKFRRTVEDVLGKRILNYVTEQEKQNSKAANLWLLFNLITYFISHYVEMRLRSDYQLRTSRLFQL
jgi:hypothetical protein